MLKIKIPYNCSISERFFIEKSSELLHSNTIDSHRLRIHNPLTILYELKNVIDSLHKGRLKNESYAISIVEEAFDLIERENELVFVSLSKNYFIQLIKIKNGAKPNLKQIFYATNLIIKDNEKYTDILFNEINSEITRINAIATPDVKEFKKINGMIGFFFIQLLHREYSKAYLYNFFRGIFFSPMHGTFIERMAILKTLIERAPEKFEVIIGISLPSAQLGKVEILNSEFKRITKKEKNKIIASTNTRIKAFFDKYKEGCIFYSIEIICLDYFSAAKLARVKIQTLCDTMHMGHSDARLQIVSECAEIGSKMPEKAAVQKLQYYLDGYYKSEQKLYREFVDKVIQLQSKGVGKNAIAKINSGLRYLRLGFESPELETKLLNYWIGLEYMFAPNEADGHTIGRVRKYFKRCHAVVYFKRNLKYLHDSILLLELESGIPDFNKDLKYFTVLKNYDYLISKLASFPLLAYRANSFKEHFERVDVTKGTIIKHQRNLDWNLNRIYRLRNEIVHNAAINPNLESITSHIRYYLVFILNGLMDFFINSPADINSDNELNIDDYFIMQEILLDNILNDKKYLSIDYLISVRNPVEFLS